MQDTKERRSAHLKKLRTEIKALIPSRQLQPTHTSPTVMEKIRTWEQEMSNNFEQSYRLQKKLGEGAHAIVHRCTHLSTGKVYAVKIMTMDCEQAIFLRGNFIDVQKLKHPNIIKYKAMYFSKNNRVCYLIMEYLPYDDLLSQTHLSEATLKDIAQKVFDALTYLHRHHVCHRDIKPENILYGLPPVNSPIFIQSFIESPIEQSNQSFNQAVKQSFNQEYNQSYNSKEQFNQAIKNQFCHLTNSCSDEQLNQHSSEQCKQQLKHNHNSIKQMNSKYNKNNNNDLNQQDTMIENKNVNKQKDSQTNKQNNVIHKKISDKKSNQIQIKQKQRDSCKRNIKENNCWVTESNEQKCVVKLIDFGVSKNMHKRGRLESMLTVTGTQLYCAPEMWLGGGYDEKVDSWAFGITLYKLITGRTPFESQYHSDTIENILTKEPDMSERGFQRYSASVRDLIFRLLRKNKDERPSAEQAKRHVWFTPELEDTLLRSDVGVSVVANTFKRTNTFNQEVFKSSGCIQQRDCPNDSWFKQMKNSNQEENYNFDLIDSDNQK